MKYLFLILAILPLACYGQVCYQDNTSCDDSYLLDMAYVDDANACLFSCQDSNKDCNEWVFYPTANPSDSNRCFHYYNCTFVEDAMDCPSCVAGGVECAPVYRCNEQGYCQGVTVATTKEDNSGICLQNCKDNAECAWFSYSTTDQFCTLFKSCGEVVAGADTISSQKECPLDSNYEKLFVAGGEGDASTSAEIVDLDGQFSCPDISPMNVGVYNAIGFHDGGKEAWVCGGNRPSDGLVLSTCQAWNAETGSWTTVSVMNEARTNHAALQINDNQIWITGGVGGSAGSSLLLSTEIFNKDTRTFTNGCRLSKVRLGHCMAAINNTHIFVTGGASSGITNEYEIYDVSTITPGSSCIKAESGTMGDARYSHFCGTAVSDSDTEIIVAEGLDGSGPKHTTYAYSKNSGDWSQGQIHPLTIQSGDSVNYGMSGFITVGGKKASDSTTPLEIYWYEDQLWKVKQGKLKVGRVHPASFLVPNDFLNCGEP